MPVGASVTVRPLAVLPVRVRVNEAVSVGPSVAVLSLLVRVTVGRSVMGIEAVLLTVTDTAVAVV